MGGLIFKAFYSDDVYLGPENLAKMAGEVGLDAGAALGYLHTDLDDQEVRSQARQQSIRLTGQRCCFEDPMTVLASMCRDTGQHLRRPQASPMSKYIFWSLQLDA